MFYIRVRHSYTQKDLVFDAIFADAITRKKSKYIIDYSRFNDTMPIPTN
jgi:hypothetical protein